MLELHRARGRGRAEIISASGPKLNERRVPLRARRCVLIGLLGAALIALGPAGELAAAGKKPVSAHKSTKAAAKNSKRGSTRAKERKTAQPRGGAPAVVDSIPLPRE